MKKYHIRFNTKHGDTDLVWRIFEDGKEHLVRHLQINVPCHDESTVEDGVIKWNICCHGEMMLHDGKAFIN